MTKIGTYQLNRMIACLAADKRRAHRENIIPADVHMHSLKEQSNHRQRPAAAPAIIKYTWRRQNKTRVMNFAPRRHSRAHQNRRRTQRLAMQTLQLLAVK
jgi:hypothetical protein